MKVSPDRGADNREQCVDRLAVERPELNRLFEEAERNHGPQDVHHDRVANVRHRNPVTQGRRAKRFPRQKHLEQELTVKPARAAAMTSTSDCSTESLSVPLSR